MLRPGTTDVLDEALDILKALLQGEEVSKNKNTLLYEKYRYRTDVEEMLQHIAGKLELKIYAGNDQLFICPEAGSRLFGWSNEELRDRISYISTNSELFTGYFIIMTLVTMFYREAYPDTPVAYIKINTWWKALPGAWLPCGRWKTWKPPAGRTSLILWKSAGSGKGSPTPGKVFPGARMTKSLL